VFAILGHISAGSECLTNKPNNQKQRDMKYLATVGKMFLSSLLIIMMSSAAFAQTSIIDEPLRDGALPAGWTQTDVTFSAAAGGYANVSGETGVLTTPTLDLTGFENVQLEFSVAKFGAGDNGPITVEISNDGGSTWTAQTFDSPVPTGSTYLTSGPTEITVTGDNVVIRFTATNSPSNKRLRDVTLTGTAVVDGSVAGVQIIHNSADPAVATVDIYVNGDLALPNVPFRGATEYLEFDANETYDIVVTPAGADISAGFSFEGITFEGGENYYVVASGVATPNDFAANPDAVSTEFFLDVIPGARLTGTGSNVDFKIYHGATDAPSVDVLASGVGPLAEGVAYTGVTAEYLSVAATAYVLDINVAGTETTAATFLADLSSLSGGSALVLASGFLDPSANEDGPAFGLIAVLANGTVVTLPTFEASDIADVRGVDNGTVVQVKGIITTPDYGFNNAEFYLQDETAGIKVRWGGFGGGNTDTPFIAGTAVSIVGVKEVFSGETRIAPSSFEVISEGNELPAPVVIDAQGWDVESPLQGSRVTLENVTLLDPSQWPTSPITSGSGVDVTVVDGDENQFTLRIDRDESYFEGTPAPEGVFTISGAFGRFNETAQLFPFFENELTFPPANVQIVHNSADPAVASVDIYINGDLAVTALDFRSATGFVELGGGVEYTIVVTPAGADISAGFTFEGVSFESGQSYYVIASGVATPNDFAANPDDVSTAFFLDVVPAKAAADETDEVEFVIYHGSPDAPGVDIDARDVAQLAADAKYTDNTGYIAVPAGAYTIDISPAGTGTIIASFGADLTPLAGGTAIVLASGFLDPAANQDGPAFGLIAVLADGTVLELDAVATSLDDQFSDAPQSFELYQNYPNPFNPSTQIRYDLAQTTNVRVEVYNVVGQRVATLVNTQQPAGTYTVNFDANALASGMYIYRIEAGNFVQVRKMMLVK